MAELVPSNHDVESPSKAGFGQGQIQVIFGPMFSGKTTELIRRLKRYQVSKHRCLIVKYAKDTRYSSAAVSTHDMQTLAAVSATELEPLRGVALQAYSVIGIDEGQFFPDCVRFAEEMANLGKIVVVAALDATFQRQGFGDILQLVPLAESVVKLNAVCMQCYRSASYTKRTGTETELEVIGGEDKYMAVCRRCFFSSAPSGGAGANDAAQCRKALFSEASTNGHCNGANRQASGSSSNGQLANGHEMHQDC